MTYDGDFFPSPFSAMRLAAFKLRQFDSSTWRRELIVAIPIAAFSGMATMIFANIYATFWYIL